MFTLMLCFISSQLSANDPNGSNQYWGGPNGESVDMLTGDLKYAVCDISIRSRGGLSINFTRTYNSELQMLTPTSGGRAIPGPEKPAPVNFAEGWHFPIVKIIDNDNTILYENGGYEPFFYDSMGRKKTRQFGVVVYEDQDSMVIQYADGTRWQFGRKLDFDLLSPNRYEGRYLRMVTAPGGASHIFYDYMPISGFPEFSGEGGVPWKIRDDDGRYVEMIYVNYNSIATSLGNNRVSELRYLGFQGQVRSIYYDYQNMRLSRVRYPSGDTIDYEYSSLYYNGTSIGHNLLSKVSFPSGAAMRYQYEPFLQKWLDLDEYCQAAAEFATTLNFAAKYVIFSDKSSHDVDSVIFCRSYDGSSGYLISQYAMSCSDCGNSEKLVSEFRNYPISKRPASCYPSADDDFGLPQFKLQFKGTWNGSRYATNATTVAKDSTSYEYVDGVGGCSCTAFPLEKGWKIAVLGENAYYPYLAGLSFHPHETPANYAEYPFLGARINTHFGFTEEYCANGDSTTKVLEAFSDTVLYRYRVLTVQTNGTGLIQRFKYNSGNPAFLDTVYTIRVIPDQNPNPPNETFRDSVAVRFQHDLYGNIVKTWDDIGFSNDQEWTTSVSYDATNTYGVETMTKDGSTTTSGVDWRLGETEWTETPTGLRTTYYYDYADRVVGIWREGDPDTTIKIKYYQDSNRKLVSETRTLSSLGSYTLSRSWNDIWGRPIADTLFDAYCQNTYGGDWHSVSSKEYNRMGQLIRSSRPRRSTEPANSTVWTSYDYDCWGRLKQVDSPDYQDENHTLHQNISRTAYDGQYVTNYAWDGRATKSKVDKYGRTTNVWHDSVGVHNWQDEGTTTYLQTTSLPITITSPAGDVITCAYDKWLRPTAVTKKDEGASRTYSDKRGFVRLIKDANGTWTYVVYDRLKRIIESGTAVVPESDTLLIDDFDYLPANRTIRVKNYYGQYFNPPAQVHDTLASSGRYGRNDYNNHSYIKGMLTQVEDEACITYYVYDMYGRISLKIVQFRPVTVPNGSVLTPRTKFIAYSHNLRNQIAGVRYPDEEDNIVYNYHKSGKLSGISDYVVDFTDLGGAAPGFRYNGWGGLEQIHGADWLSEYISYDSLSRIEKVGVEAIVGDQPFAESYAYENQYLSRVYKENTPMGTPTWNQLQRSHWYDYRGRVKRVKYETPNVEIHGYAYNEANNRVADTTITVGTIINHYNLYDNSNRLKNVSTIQGFDHEKYTYDNNGNVLVDSAKSLTFEYDYRNLIKSAYHRIASGQLINRVDTVVFAYNAQNQRVMKLQKYWYMGQCSPGGGEDFLDPGGEMDSGGPGDPPGDCFYQGVLATFYVWSGNEIIAEYDQRDSATFQYIYANGRRIATVHVHDNHTKTREFNHYDGSGSLRRVTSLEEGVLGHIMQDVEYDIWGNIRALSGLVPPFTFTGQQWDRESGLNLFYLRNRYYDPTIGRFTTPDPMTADLNPYAYCNNNPVMIGDPTGLTGIAFSGPNAREQADSWFKQFNEKHPGLAVNHFYSSGGNSPCPGDPDYVDLSFKPRLNANGEPLLVSGDQYQPWGGGALLIFTIPVVQTTTTVSISYSRSSSSSQAGFVGPPAPLDVDAVSDAIADAFAQGLIGAELGWQMYDLVNSGAVQTGNIADAGNFGYTAGAQGGTTTMSNLKITIAGDLSVKDMVVAIAKETVHWASATLNYRVLDEIANWKGSPVYRTQNAFQSFCMNGPLAYMAAYRAAGATNMTWTDAQNNWCQADQPSVLRGWLPYCPNCPNTPMFRP